MFKRFKMNESVEVIGYDCELGEVLRNRLLAGHSYECADVDESANTVLLNGNFGEWDKDDNYVWVDKNQGAFV